MHILSDVVPLNNIIHHLALVPAKAYFSNNNILVPSYTWGNFSLFSDNYPSIH